MIPDSGLGGQEVGQMGRSRKKSSSGTGKENNGELRNIVLLLVVVSVLIGLTIVILISGAIRKSRQEEPQLAASHAVESEAAEMKESIASAAELILEPDNQEYIYDFGTSILAKDEVPEINQLMEQYFMSISDCDMATFLHLFTSQDMSEEDYFRQEFEQQRQYIEGYQNISCYTVPGLQENELVAYVYYEIRYIGVETAAPSLVRIYAVKGEDGTYQIYDQEMSEELNAYLEQLAVNEDVRLLSMQVDQKMEEAMEADPALKERVEFMQYGASYMQEDTQEEEQNESENEG